MKSLKLSVLICLACILMLSACQPTPETAAVQNKGGSLMDMISGNYDYEPEDAAALGGQTWNEQVYKTDEIDVMVDAQILTQDVEGYPAVRVTNDKDNFMHSDSLEKMTGYFFKGYEPYYKTAKPSKSECTINILWLEQALSSGLVIDSRADSTNEKLEYYKNEYATASDDIPFDIKEDPYGEEYMRVTGIDNKIGLVVYSDDGMAYIDVSKYELMYSRRTSLDQYDYEIGLNSLDDVPESVRMDAGSALKIAEDSINAIAAGEDMELVRMATINRVSPYMTDVSDYQYLEPECLVFYFMRSYGGVRQTYIGPADIGFFSHDGDPEYSPDVCPECIRVVVDGLNIVHWSWIYPGMTTDVISDDVPIMPFEQIKDIFRRQIKNHFAYLDYNEIQTINIDRIVLGMMKISEKDNPDSYLVIPVWDFIGTENIVFKGADYGGGDADYSYLTINAIDGTIIDRVYGY